MAKEEEQKMTRAEHWKAINEERAKNKKDKPQKKAIPVVAKKKSGVFGNALLKRNH